MEIPLYICFLFDNHTRNRESVCVSNMGGVNECHFRAIGIEYFLKFEYKHIVCRVRNGKWKEKRAGFASTLYAYAIVWLSLSQLLSVKSPAWTEKTEDYTSPCALLSLWIAFRRFKYIWGICCEYDACDKQYIMFHIFRCHYCSCAIPTLFTCVLFWWVGFGVRFRIFRKNELSYESDVHIRTQVVHTKRTHPQ